MKKATSFTVVTVIFLSMVGLVEGITITDRFQDDLNAIVGTNQNNVTQVFTVMEDYNEDNLIPNPFFGSNPVVTFGPSVVVDHDPGEPVRFFDESITKDGATGKWGFRFQTANTTNFQWSDYHFQLFNADFTNSLDLALGDLEAVGLPLGTFQGVSVDPALGAVSYFQGEGNGLAPGKSLTFQLNINLNAVPDTFGIRQMASTDIIPEPTTMTLLGIGLLGLRSMFLHQRKR